MAAYAELLNARVAMRLPACLYGHCNNIAFSSFPLLFPIPAFLVGTQGLNFQLHVPLILQIRLSL